MEYILYNALAALFDCQNSSLLGVNRMLCRSLNGTSHDSATLALAADAWGDM
jgi:hypothetical protein